MAQGFLKSFDNKMEVYSAGTSPATRVNPRAVKVMAEVGIDISMNSPKHVDDYLNDQWDYVITVCDDANETCPFFIGKVKHRLHMGFEDPSHVIGSDEFIISEFRRVRDEIKMEFFKLYNTNLKVNQSYTMDDAKGLVKEKYGKIAYQSLPAGSSSCCGPSCCGDGADYVIFSESYKNLNGYDPEADLGLGCGIPTEFAGIKKGDTVVDLGSGAGNDCFVARALTGDTGEVIGIDMTEQMIEKARNNVKKLGYSNVEFRLGDIEDMPVKSDSTDVVISNCVLNLVPDKGKAFSEIFRILKPGGHLSVSDIVLRGELPEKIKQAAEMYAGCVSGAIEIEEYLRLMTKAGLTNLLIQKEKTIFIPDEIMLKYLDPLELTGFRKSNTGIYSITVYAEKLY
jgi:SAM-dependent methyltransferase/protein-tyrosine-phosphatase